MTDEDIGSCDQCGRKEHIYLLDGKSDEDGDHDALLCIECYGPGWCPADDYEHINLSICPDLKPLYERWMQKNPAEIISHLTNQGAKR